MMHLCNTSASVKGLTRRNAHFTLITNVTLGLLGLRITWQDSAKQFCMEQKYEHDFDRCISNRNGRFH